MTDWLIDKSALRRLAASPAAKEWAARIERGLVRIATGPGPGPPRRPRTTSSAIPDLLVAAAAQLSGLTVLHLDKDFELIAGITGQPTERLAT